MLRLHTRPRGPSPLTPLCADGTAVLRPDLGGDYPLLSSHPHFKIIPSTVLEYCSHFRPPSNFFPIHSPLSENLKK